MVEDNINKKNKDIAYFSPIIDINSKKINEEQRAKKEENEKNAGERLYK